MEKAQKSAAEIGGIGRCVRGIETKSAGMAQRATKKHQGFRTLSQADKRVYTKIYELRFRQENQSLKGILWERFVGDEINFFLGFSYALTFWEISPVHLNVTKIIIIPEILEHVLVSQSVILIKVIGKILEVLKIIKGGWGGHLRMKVNDVEDVGLRRS